MHLYKALHNLGQGLLGCNVV